MIFVILLSFFLSFFYSYLFPELTQDCSLNVTQLNFTRSSAVDVNDFIIIKFIVTYYCLSAQSVFAQYNGMGGCYACTNH